MVAKKETVNKITQEGYDALVAELQELQKKRPEIVNEIEKARADGDLKENGAYHAAREQLSFNDGRIEEIEAILKNAKVTETKSKTIVGLGTKVKLVSEDKATTLQVTIVGASEADFAAGKMSCESPIGKAVLGKKSGSVVTVQTPKGATKYNVDIIK
ncbi:MAG: transcription elongation factor GreA [Dehalococcoidales bacterium]|nr:transcription elongation factor GreA [Dehalococcoidales bacterium]